MQPPPLIILLWLSSMTSYCDVYFLSIAEYKNEHVPKIDLTAKEPQWDPSREEYSEKESHMLDHQGQINIPANAARGPICVSKVISYSLAYDAADAMDNDNLVTAL